MAGLMELEGDENSGEHARTFVFHSECNTLGDALKSVVSRLPEVEFCGYTIPHPTEHKIHFRLQTYKPHRAIDILEKGLEELEQMCGHLLSVFETEVASYGN